MDGGDHVRNIVGVDIGGTKCAVVLGRWDHGHCDPGLRSCVSIHRPGVSVHRSGVSVRRPGPEKVTILDRVSFPTPISAGWDAAVQQLESAIDEVLGRNGLRPTDVWRIGISCGGPLDSKRGIIMSPPNLPGWDNVEIVRILEDRFGVQALLQNDANAGALAEWLFGAARGYSNVIFMTFGTGLGAGLILDGRLYSGTSDMAGEVGHIRLERFGPVGYGKAGSWEGFCSGGGIAQLARSKALERLQAGEKVSFCASVDELDKVTAKSVAEAASNGDQLAREIYRISGHYLGMGCAILIDILNPEVIVIGSVFARATDLLWPEAKQVIESESLVHSHRVCRVVPAALGEAIGDYAALSVALAADEDS